MKIQHRLLWLYKSLILVIIVDPIGIPRKAVMFTDEWNEKYIILAIC